MRERMQASPSFSNPPAIGILGGGQLGKMLLQAGIDLHLDFRVLDPSPEAPCRHIAAGFTLGDFADYETVMRFGENCDLLTIEIEHVHADALEALRDQGKTVYPSPEIIRLVQDKRKQKQFYLDHGLPTAPFTLVSGKSEVAQMVDTFPKVYKSGKAGYDGRGVQVLRSPEDLVQAFDAAGLVEDWVPFEKEIAIIVARNPQGEIDTFPAVEMVFHPVHNLVEYLISPADLPPSILSQAKAIAHSLAEKISLVGVLAVEMFVTRDHEVLINEVAPRPHNSGHHTIRACLTSQYEQHLRAILGLPLGATDLLCPAAMVNMLGAPGQNGSATYPGLAELLALPGVYPFLYGKAETRPYRKMGHITLLQQDRAALADLISRVQPLAQVYAEDHSSPEEAVR